VAADTARVPVAAVRRAAAVGDRPLRSRPQRPCRRKRARLLV